VILIWGLSVNKTFALASGFWTALAAPQSQNPRRSTATPAVLLNLRHQISPKSGAIPKRLIYGQALDIFPTENQFTISSTTSVRCF
jgi:hypothetical protein